MQLTKTVSFLGLYFLVCILISCQQQVNKDPAETKTLRMPVSVNDSTFLSIDRSTMDMSYFPVDYPKEKMISTNMDNLVARVIYSRPQKNGRMIFADTSVMQNFIQHYGKEWRLGANEATEIEFFKPVNINGKSLSKGRYIMYCIPYSDKWIIVFNENLFSWGLHFDKTKDVLNVELPITKGNTPVEFLTMAFQEAAHGCNLVIAWGDIKVMIPISFN